MKLDDRLLDEKGVERRVTGEHLNRRTTVAMLTKYEEEPVYPVGTTT
jgi:hypothetical protein